MKSTKIIATYIVFLIALGAVPGLSGCASHREHDTESLLSAAGFRTMTPSTPQQQASYESLPAHKIQRLERNGRVVYAYADKKAGIVYVGNEAEYQRFQQLAEQQKIANEEVESSEMNEDAAMNWGVWGPAGFRR